MRARRQERVYRQHVGFSRLRIFSQRKQAMAFNFINAGHNVLSDPVASLIIVAAALLLGAVAQAATSVLLKRWSIRHQTTRKISLRLEKLRMPLGMLFIAFFISSAIPFLRLPPAIILIADHLLSLLVIATCAWLLIRMAAVVREMLLSRLNAGEKNNLKASAAILGTVFLYADFTLPVDKMREELGRILKQNPKWDGKVNVLQITDMKDRTVELRALMSAADSSDAWDLRCEVREALLIYMETHFPRSLPKVRLDRSP